MVRTITQHQQELGRLDLIFDPQPLRNKLMKSLITLTIVFCVALVFLVILSLFFSERLARPILAMADRINDMRRFLSEGHPLPPTLRLHVDIGNQKETHHLKNGIDALLGQVALREQQNQQAHQEITRLNQDLEARVQRRTRELSDSVDQLKAAQESIVQAEKMSALGRMVAGVAHEINTPLGIAVSLASHHCEQVEQLIQDVEHQRLSRQQFQQFLEDQRQGSQLIFENLSRANRQIQSFKKVAADQSGEEKRVFDLLQYCQEIVVSMHNQLKKKKVKIRLLVEPNLKIFSYPGIFFQILSNLIVNALVHAFDQTEHPEIVLKAQLQAQPKTSHPETHTLILHFSDNGCGVKPSSVAKLFEPFFTTKRQEGGTGLGLNIVYNLVVHQLNGQIQFLEGESKGAHWLLTLPVEVP
jgi:C4-dicarboxylate-specific signal transduction histidine kinase